MKLQFIDPKNNTVDFEFTGKNIKDLYNNILEEQGDEELGEPINNLIEYAIQDNARQEEQLINNDHVITILALSNSCEDEDIDTVDFEIQALVKNDPEILELIFDKLEDNYYKIKFLK